MNRCFAIFYSMPNEHKTQEMFDRVVSDDLFLTVHCPDKHITHKLCDEAVDDSIATWKLIPNWFVTCKMIKKLFTALYADENILYFIIQ